MLRRLIAERGRVVQQRRERRGLDTPGHAQADEHEVEADDGAVIRVGCGACSAALKRPQGHKRVRGRSTSTVMSATSRAMAAPSLMAMPASASDRAGESFTPSPSMMTVRPWPRARRG